MALVFLDRCCSHSFFLSLSLSRDGTKRATHVKMTHEALGAPTNECSFLLTSNFLNIIYLFFFESWVHNRWLGEHVRSATPVFARTSGSRSQSPPNNHGNLEGSCSHFRPSACQFMHGSEIRIPILPTQFFWHIHPFIDIYFLNFSMNLTFPC